jgi:hypothetical protein
MSNETALAIKSADIQVSGNIQFGLDAFVNLGVEALEQTLRAEMKKTETLRLGIIEDIEKLEVQNMKVMEAAALAQVTDRNPVYQALDALLDAGYFPNTLEKGKLPAVYELAPILLGLHQEDKCVNARIGIQLIPASENGVAGTPTVLIDRWYQFQNSPEVVANMATIQKMQETTGHLAEKITSIKRKLMRTDDTLRQVRNEFLRKSIEGRPEAEMLREFCDQMQIRAMAACDEL